MAARVCKPCKINYPVSDDFAKCQACGGNARYALIQQPHQDWAARVEAAKPKAAHSRYESRSVIANRALRLQQAGLEPYHLVLELAGARHPEHGGYVVSVHEFEKLVGCGATPDQAARILG